MIPPQGMIYIFMKSHLFIFSFMVLDFAFYLEISFS